jgi:hypothetical protein
VSPTGRTLTSQRIATDAKQALNEPADFYFVVQIRRPWPVPSTSSQLKRRWALRSRQRKALRSLHLGEVGDKVVVARKAEFLRIVIQILPLVVITPIIGSMLSPGLEVLEDFSGQNMNLLPAYVEMLSDIHWDVEVPVEEPSTVESNSDLLETIEKIGRKIRPDLNEASLEIRARAIVSEIQNYSDAEIETRLRQMSAEVQRSLVTTEHLTNPPTEAGKD